MQQMYKPYEGIFITVEGGEGCGKSTLCEKLKKHFSDQKLPFLHTREPGGTKLSEHLREIILNPPTDCSISDRTELLLFLAARTQHLDETILPALHMGKLVFCERFNDSTIAYQGCARNLGMHHVEQLCKLACQGAEPQLTLLLDIDPIIGLNRAKAQRKHELDRMEKEDLQFHKDIRQGFLHLADQYPDRIKIIDAQLSPEAVFEAALQAIKPFLVIR